MLGLWLYACQRTRSNRDRGSADRAGFVSDVSRAEVGRLCLWTGKGDEGASPCERHQLYLTGRHADAVQQRSLLARLIDFDTGSFALTDQHKSWLRQSMILAKDKDWQIGVGASVAFGPLKRVDAF